jgi:hypothetical protein
MIVLYTAVMVVIGIQQLLGSVVYSSVGGQWYSAMAGSVLYSGNGCQWYSAMTVMSGMLQ